ncbi:unannotated protein [freshwater metagenome]|jgi:dihydroneopterin aldolase|uniref:dihydroneopterin aldolase n=1 Tax=freshwater metagenome TaxID=449393 RepID=A0A6J7CJ97_9ZZZZ|nr:dihydroneopterin aldolase [Actinomycetota bacterium]
MSDVIALTGLRAFGYHGVLASEKQTGQEFIVDLLLHTDIQRAASTDNLADTIDYAALAHAVVTVVEGEPVDLIETLAQRIADVVLIDSRVLSVKVVLHKPSAPIPHEFDDVRIEIDRSR